MGWDGMGWDEMGFEEGVRATAAVVVAMAAAAAAGWREHMQARRQSIHVSSGKQKVGEQTRYEKRCMLEPPGWM